jgi:hypothetical protein
MSLLHGFDISAYQSATSPAADFVLVKASEGKSYTSSRFAAQWKSAKTKAKHRGAYHFARPEDSSAASQAARFLSIVEPVPGESVWLDLEASDLSQAKTNTWAKAWGDYIREHAPGVTSGVYFGSGYASNNTGKGLADHFDHWWYPQYPSAYQVTVSEEFRMETEELRRAANRASFVESRHLIAASTTKWPPSVSPWLPSGIAATGWSKPHIWQFTDNWSGLDASVTALTLDQLAGSGAQPLEDEDSMYAQAAGYPPPTKVGERHTHACPKGKLNIWGIAFDSPHTLTYKLAMHSQAKGGTVKELTVGGSASDTDSWPKKVTFTVDSSTVDWFSIELVKAEGPTADWDPTMPGADGKTVFPGWDASHTA